MFSQIRMGFLIKTARVNRRLPLDLFSLMSTIQHVSQLSDKCLYSFTQGFFSSLAKEILVFAQITIFKLDRYNEIVCTA